jgi:hypothetical protein
MSKDRLYKGIKNIIYREIDSLQVSERNDGIYVYLHYKNPDRAQIVIEKNSGWVFYYYRFKDKIFKKIPLENRDFEILLEQWVEDKFQIKVTGIWRSKFLSMAALNIPPK